MKSYPGVVLFMTAVFASCTVFSPHIVEAPRFIRERAFDEATRYIGMEYEPGGQDFPKGIDCSGLLVNVYYTATRGTDYRLLFTDAAVSHLHEQYTSRAATPQQGDLVFMGESGVDDVTHIGILDRIEGGSVYFIDSTYMEDPPQNGVSLRSYSEEDPKIKGYGRLLLLKYR
jgi:hypothetical protein